ncbi:MAG: nucleotidyl transferase AbiEii/AbiGii toxin family protein [Legionella sp.]|uniref:nucleotidyl transferase AbiEii/AbiGii toxin family protein n=1 Tax=Legionella sp. TaxID=459 RepID=UPI0039E31046
MTQLHLLSVIEREAFFDATVAESRIPFEIIEKDFWVVWILERLFSLPNLKDHLTFKGGTSLSKVYGVIQRFSEDVDLSIEKEFFGFDKLNDPEKAVSKKKQRAMLADLAVACSGYIQNKLITTLRTAIFEKLETLEGWRLEIDPDDPDGQTLQFEYPSTIKKDSYIRPSVKIELGARSEHWPVNKHKIQSYVKNILKEKVEEPEVWVKVLEAKRTFWEKATILHQYAHLPHDKKLPPRISRHYYDFFCLLNSPIKVHALEDCALLDRVATHKSIYFASAWANYGAVQKGNLKLVPPPYIFESLERDYGLMKDMFFGSIPEWPAILNVINDFEMEFNQKN